MSRPRTVGVTVAILFAVFLIVAFALGQPASDGSAGQLPAVPKGRAVSGKQGRGPQRGELLPGRRRAHVHVVALRSDDDRP